MRVFFDNKGLILFIFVIFRMNINKNRFIFRVNLPDIRFRGDYDIDMKLLLLKYKGQGPISGYFSKSKHINYQLVLKSK